MRFTNVTMSGNKPNDEVVGIQFNVCGMIIAILFNVVTIVVATTNSMITVKAIIIGKTCGIIYSHTTIVTQLDTGMIGIHVY